MNSLDRKYKDLLVDIINNGVEKKDRTGTGTISVFGRQIRHNMSEGYPLLTTKKMAFKTMVTELLWFLKGDTNIKYLVENGCHIWDGDAFANYYRNFEKYLNTLPEGSEVEFIINKDKFINKIKTDDEFAKKWGELGPIYGKQWRSWNTLKWEATDKIDPTHPDRPMLKWNIEGIDQIANLIKDLKTNPDSRRLMVSAWNVGELGEMVLPPCHYGFQVYTRELSDDERQKWVIDNVDWVRNSEDPEHEANKYLYRGEPKVYGDSVPTRAISLMYNARSQDVPLGTPFNIASYALLLEIIGRMVNMVPDELITNMGDCHIYKNQVDGVKEQLIREPYPLPKLVISDGVNFTGTIDEFLNSCSISDFKIEGYQSHPTIKMPLSN